MKSTISVSREVKGLLERKKREMEIKLERSLTWDEFFQEMFKQEEPPKLTEEGAKILKKLVSEDRKNWRIREFA